MNYSIRVELLTGPPVVYQRVFYEQDSQKITDHCEHVMQYGVWDDNILWPPHRIHYIEFKEVANG